MNDFWAKRLGQQRPQEPAPAPQQPAPANQPWWAVPRPQQPAPAPPQAPPAGTQTAPVQQAPLPQSQPDGEVPIEVLWSDPNYRPTKPPKSDRLSGGEVCPACRSGNYLNIGGLETRAKRCFDCGYNPMFEHSTAGASAVDKDTPTRTARGQTLQTSNFNPSKIIGRV